MNGELVLARHGTRGRPQVRRERADQLVVALVVEAGLINDDPLAWYEVTKLSVFGSYLSNKPVLGDLDIAVRTTPRWRHGTDGFTRAWREFPLACPAPAAIACDQLTFIHWPRLYVLRRLKRLGRGISVHSQEDLDSCGFKHHVVFEKPEVEVRQVR